MFFVARLVYCSIFKVHCVAFNLRNLHRVSVGNIRQYKRCVDVVSLKHTFINVAFTLRNLYPVAVGNIQQY
jgi:hypothetical protein